MRVAILGAGAMGSLVGAFLKKGGAEVLLIDPYKAHMDKINSDGLELHLNKNVEIIPLQAHTSSAGLSPVDVLIVLVKGMYTIDALKGVTNIIDDSTYVLTLQNGIGNADNIAGLIPEDRVLQGVMKIVSKMLGPGAVESNTMPGITAIYIGSKNGNAAANDKAKAMADIFNNAGIKTDYEDNINHYIWAKAINNISINAACAVAGTTIAEFATNENGRTLLKNCIHEVAQVAACMNVRLDESEVLRSIDENTVKKVGHHIPSTAQDIQAKRLTEIDFLNGAIVRYGKQFDIPTPYNEAITIFIKLIETSF